MSERMRCSSHDCELVEIQPGVWDCPLSALVALVDQFRDLYESTYFPAPAGENGVFHRASQFALAASRAVEQADAS